MEYFTNGYGESVNGAIIKNPEADDFANVSAGSVVRFGGHTKLFIGYGFVDDTGRNFVPSKRGKPLIASGYNDRFSYFTGGDCVVVDIPKIIEYKLQHEARRHTR